MRILLLLLLVSCIPRLAGADYILGPPEVNKTLKALALFQREQHEAKDAAAKAEVLAKLAKEANYLVSLINLEIRSHGFEQKPLIDLTVSRCEQLNVIITYDSRKERYVYDQGAYAEYIRLHPSGPDAQEARYQVFERTFYSQKSTDLPGITRLIYDIKEFLALYPEDTRRSELELFQVVLHRDLFRIKAAEPGGGLDEKARVENLCKALIAKYPASPEARVAETILKNLK